MIVRTRKKLDRIEIIIKMNFIDELECTVFANTEKSLTSIRTHLPHLN